jgi:hypothetical protein
MVGSHGRQDATSHATAIDPRPLELSGYSVTRVLQSLAIVIGAASAVACSSDSTAPASCQPETTVLTATVTTGASVTFNWSPGCAIAALIVEEGTSGRWGISTPATSWNSQVDGNLILAPVTYGVSVVGVPVTVHAQALVPGTEYNVSLWRVLPFFSTATCLQKIGNLCLTTTRTFTR